MITLIVTSQAVIAIRCCVWTKKLVVTDFLFFGGGVILQHLYLNVYAEFDSKISYIG